MPNKDEEKSPEAQPGQPELNFGGSSAVAVAGTLSGVAIALGGTWLVLAYGPALSLGTTLSTALVIVALALGGGVSVVAAFFGLVMPRHMHGPWLDPAHWERLHERKLRWREARWRMRRRWAMGLDPEEDGEEQDGDEAPRRKRARR
jgi:hypothetical protein